MILIVEDDVHINDMMAEALQQEGYACVQAFSGTEALLHLERGGFELMLLDLMLPGKSGDALLGEIKPDHPIPVIVVTAKDELDSKVDLLQLGAEDYITKPFEIRELLARVQVQLRKKNTGPILEQRKYKDLILDKDGQQVQYKTASASLTRLEFAILELLFRHPNKIFSKQEIYDHAWDDLYMGEDKTVNVHMSNIRQKLKSISEKEYIETVWGVGFKLV